MAKLMHAKRGFERAKDAEPKLQAAYPPHLKIPQMHTSIPMKATTHKYIATHPETQDRCPSASWDILKDILSFVVKKKGSMAPAFSGDIPNLNGEVKKCS